MTTQLYFAVAYDISDDRRRSRVAHLLEGYGTRVQYSVFEARLDERRALTLMRRLQQILDPEDRLRVYHIVGGPERHVIAWGGPPSVESPMVSIV